MKALYKNNWAIQNKSSKKVNAKIRFGKITIFDLYFTIGLAQVNITLFNHSWEFKK